LWKEFSGTRDQSSRRRHSINNRERDPETSLRPKDGSHTQVLTDTGSYVGCETDTGTSARGMRPGGLLGAGAPGGGVLTLTGDKRWRTGKGC
jgi:hypothetical protein